MVIVGGGFSGLWTAHSLIRADPSLRIAIVEREYCGFGASGRNGGWAVGELAAGPGRYARESSIAQSMGLLRALFDTVDEIGRVTGEEGIDCHFAKGGWIRVARSPAQAKRQREELDEVRALGLDEDDIRLLEIDEARAHLGASEVHSGIFFAHCAALDPARLARGLADVVEGAGVEIFEGTEVVGLGDRRVETGHGTVTAEVVIRATEAYTRDLPGARRDLLPIYSLMVATEPLPADVLAEVGLGGRPTFSDDRHFVTYGQRTADDRIAFGSPGVPYLFGSRISPANETRLASHQEIHRVLVEMVPALRGVAITHRWGGVLAAPRNWVPGLRFDRATGHGVLGGYVGEGVAAANLAGRTMADLVLGRDTDLTTMAWVGVRSRHWEPEPARWLGVRGSRKILGWADRREATSGAEARLAFRLSRLLRGGN